MQNYNGSKDMLQQKESCCDLCPAAMTWLKSNSYRENLKGLDSVRFRNPSSGQHSHLDVGCGPGNFLQEHLLPRLRPCKRVVAVDNSPRMLEYAARHCQEPEVTFDFLNIEKSDAQRFLHTYGSFDRVYSFLTFHYVWDLAKAYRNVYDLLKAGGECLILYCTRTTITDVFQRIHEKEEWNAYTPDLKIMFSERYRFDATVPEEELMADERKAVTTAGLELVSCRAYASHWTFPTVDDCLDQYIPFFKMTSMMPQEKRNAFREAAQRLVLQASTGDSEEISIRYNVIVVHAQKLKRN